MAYPVALRALATCLSRYDRRMANQFGNQVALALGCPHTLIVTALAGDLHATRIVHDTVLPGWGYRIDAPQMPGGQASVRVDVTRPGYASWDQPLAWPDGIGATARAVELAWTAALCLAKAEMLERNG